MLQVGHVNVGQEVQTRPECVEQLGAFVEPPYSLPLRAVVDTVQALYYPVGVVDVAQLLPATPVAYGVSRWAVPLPEPIPRVVLLGWHEAFVSLAPQEASQTLEDYTEQLLLLPQPRSCVEQLLPLALSPRPPQ